MKLTKKLSLSAMLTALSFILLFIGRFAETLTFSTSAVASICIAVAVCELGYTYAAMIYLASSLLGFLLQVGDPLIYYSMFFGYYPIFKSLIEKIPSKLTYLLKGILFLAAYTLVSFIGIKFITVDPEIFKYLLILAPVLLVVFYVFDYAFTKLITYYCTRLRKQLGIDKFLR